MFKDKKDTRVLKTKVLFFLIMFLLFVKSMFLDFKVDSFLTWISPVLIVLWTSIAIYMFRKIASLEKKKDFKAKANIK